MRIRVWKTSVHAAVSYGIEAQGLAPQRLRLNCPATLAFTRGNVDIVFDQHGHLQDPKDTAVERQLKAMHQLIRAWPDNQWGELVQGVLEEIAGGRTPLDCCCWTYGSFASISHGDGLGRVSWMIGSDRQLV